MKKSLLIVLLFWSCLSFAADTLLKLYRPYGATVSQVMPVIKNKLAGTCMSQSRLIIREDAWRCRAKHVIYDPCFVKSTGSQKTVICPQSPWVGDSVQIVLNAPLVKSTFVPLDMSRTLPWGIELITGELCHAINAKEMYDGMPIRYACTHQTILMGYLQRCNPVWRMLGKTVNGVKTIELKRAWF
jgi:hypothetical protein